MYVMCANWLKTIDRVCTIYLYLIGLFIRLYYYTSNDGVEKNMLNMAMIS